MPSVLRYSGSTASDQTIDQLWDNSGPSLPPVSLLVSQVLPVEAYSLPFMPLQMTLVFPWDCVSWSLSALLSKVQDRLHHRSPVTELLILQISVPCGTEAEMCSNMVPRAKKGQSRCFEGYLSQLQRSHKCEIYLKSFSQKRESYILEGWKKWKKLKFCYLYC